MSTSWRTRHKDEEEQDAAIRPSRSLSHRFTQLAVLSMTALLLTISAPAVAAPVLVFGDRTGEQATLAADLTALGHTVTNVSTAAAAGLDFTSFDAVWTVNIFSSFDSLLPSLQAALAAGAGIHFTGERPCCEAANDTIESFLNANVIGGGIQVGDLGDPGSAGVFNPLATGDITTSPNVLTTWNPVSSGGMSGVFGDNILATIGSVTVGAAFDSSELLGGSGRISVLMDVNWFSGSDIVTEPIVENIQAFLLAGAQEEPNRVPAPGTLALFGFGLIGLAFMRRRRLAT